MKPETFHRLAGRFLEVVALYQELHRRPWVFNGLSLSPAEWHLLEAIGDLDGPGVTRLASWLGVSKGAVSQTLKKLEHKGLVLREQDPEHGRKIRLLLSPVGQGWYGKHKDWHAEGRDGGLIGLMEAFSEEEGAVLHRFLERFRGVLEKIQVEPGEG